MNKLDQFCLWMLPFCFIGMAVGALQAMRTPEPPVRTELAQPLTPWKYQLGGNWLDAPQIALKAGHRVTCQEPECRQAVEMLHDVDPDLFLQAQVWDKETHRNLAAAASLAVIEQAIRDLRIKIHGSRGPRVARPHVG